MPLAADSSPVRDEIARRPRLDLDYGDDVEKRFPEIAGGLSVALARSFKIVEPELKNP